MQFIHSSMIFYFFRGLGIDLLDNLHNRYGKNMKEGIFLHRAKDIFCGDFAGIVPYGWDF